jgi:hypothetical protein
MVTLNDSIGSKQGPVAFLITSGYMKVVTSQMSLYEATETELGKHCEW